MIHYLYLNSFTCFAECNLTFSKGINVFIGTGKTHIMKCLAASMKVNASFGQSTSKTKDKFGDLFTEKLLGYLFTGCPRISGEQLWDRHSPSKTGNGNR